jgi:hypothetical protein
MATYLLTVESVQAHGELLQVLPKVPIGSIATREPNLIMPMRGDSLELRLPDGTVQSATVHMFGVEAWERDGRLYTTSAPDNPELTLTIAGGLKPEDVPEGTEIWLAHPTYG